MAQNQRALLTALLGVVGQVGCLTLAIVMAAMLGGLWLDSYFQTRPWITLGLILLSVPLTFLLILRTVLSRAERIQELSSKTLVKITQEEAEGDGRQTDSSEA